MNSRFELNLLNNASKLDALADEAGQITECVRKIIDEADCDSIRLLLKKIDAFSEQTDKKIKILSSEVYNSLLIFLGKQKIEEINDICQEEVGEDKTLEELLAELDSYVGLRVVKDKVSELIAFHKIQKLREKENLKNVSSTLHMAFIGNPGTGKTSVARILGRMYKKIGLLSKGHFMEVSRTDLIAGYQGQTALKVKKVMEKAKGGVLFIDEAYSITENSNSDSYGRECLTELTKALEDYRNDLVVIVAGYKTPMEQFFESNPGLKSRFNNFIYFDDYNENQLLEIFENMCRQGDYCVADELRQSALAYFAEQASQKDEYFSNGRVARNLYEDLIMNHAKRIVNVKKPTKEYLSLLKNEDFTKKKNRP